MQINPLKALCLELSQNPTPVAQSLLLLIQHINLDISPVHLYITHEILQCYKEISLIEKVTQALRENFDDLHTLIWSISPQQKFSPAFHVTFSQLVAVSNTATKIALLSRLLNKRLFPHWPDIHLTIDALPPNTTLFLIDTLRGFSDSLVEALTPQLFDNLLFWLYRNHLTVFLQFLKEPAIFQRLHSPDHLKALAPWAPACVLLQLGRSLKLHSEKNLVNKKDQADALLMGAAGRRRPKAFFRLAQLICPTLLKKTLLTKSVFNYHTNLSKYIITLGFPESHLQGLQYVFTKITQVSEEEKSTDNKRPAQRILKAWHAIQESLLSLPPTDFKAIHALVRFNQLIVETSSPQYLHEGTILYTQMVMRQLRPKHLAKILIAIANTRKDPYRFLRNCLNDKPSGSTQEIKNILWHNSTLHNAVILKKGHNCPVPKIFLQIYNTLKQHEDYHLALFNLTLLTAASCYTSDIVPEIIKYLPLELLPHKDHSHSPKPTSTSSCPALCVYL